MYNTIDIPDVLYFDEFSPSKADRKKEQFKAIFRYFVDAFVSDMSTTDKRKFLEDKGTIYASLNGSKNKLVADCIEEALGSYIEVDALDEEDWENYLIEKYYRYIIDYAENLIKEQKLKGHKTHAQKSNRPRLNVRAMF